MFKNDTSEMSFVSKTNCSAKTHFPYVIR